MAETTRAIIDAVMLVQPEIVLIAGACLLFLGAAFYQNRHLWALLAVLSVMGAGLTWWVTGDWKAATPSASLFIHDPFVWFLKGIGLAFGLLLVLFSWNQVRDRQAGEFHGCLLSIIAGVNFVAAANDLVSLFLALELISIPTYVLLYLPRYDAASQEAATKYFLLSVFSSALLLYGLSFFYGTVGSTNLEVIRVAVKEAGASSVPGVLLIAMVMVVAGLGFRITAVPFHFYAPDVYQGAPTVMAALLAFLPKVAGFVALYRLITVTLLVDSAGQASVLDDQATLLFWILAAVTMFLGNLMALLQDNLKRLLAYSSVAHAGYMLIGLGAGHSKAPTFDGLEALFFYLVIYGAMTIGAFAVLAYLSRPERPVETVDDLAGLGRSHPGIALMMTVFMFSLTGLPPTAGFWGKLALFLASWSEGSRLFQVLAIFLAINAAIGAWYYLRVVAVMYLRQPVKPLARVVELPILVCLVACTLVTIGLFVAPGPLWNTVAQTNPQPAAATAVQP